MGWTTPRDWVAGEIVTASIMNTHARDQFLYLKGVGQVPAIQSGLTIDNSLGSERLLLPLLSTTECATVLNAEGEVAHDEQTHRIKVYDGTALRSIVSTADVDDTPVNGATTDPISSNWAYDFQQALTTAGDTPYATSAGVWNRLGIGAAGQFLKTNSGATAPEWGAAAAVPPLLASLFMTNAATGTMTSPERINDNLFVSPALADAVDEYAEVNLGRDFLIYQYRQYGEVNNTGNGLWKLQYYDTSWHDWITGIPVRKTADWSVWAVGSIVIGNKIRLVCTTVDALGSSRLAEFAVAYGQSA